MMGTHRSRSDTFAVINTPLDEPHTQVVVDRFTKSGYQNTTLMQLVLGAQDIFAFVTFEKVITELAESQGVLLRLCFLFDTLREHHLAKLLRLVEEPLVHVVIYHWASLALPATKQDLLILTMLIRDRTLNQELRDSLANSKKKFDSYVVT